MSSTQVTTENVWALRVCQRGPGDHELLPRVQAEWRLPSCARGMRAALQQAQAEDPGAGMAHRRSTADLMSFRSCMRAFLMTPLNRNIIGIDRNLATIR